MISSPAIASAMVALSLSSAAFAQSTVAPAAAAVVVPVAEPAVVPATAVTVPALAETILRAGTEIALTTSEELTTKKKKLRVGQRFQLQVASNITAGGAIVIPGGTPVVGEVTEVRNKGMWGKSGFISARILSMRLADRTIRMSGTFDDKGVAGGVGAALVSGIVFLPAGFFMTGTSALIPIGAPVKAFLEEDVAFKLVTPTP